MVAVFQPSKMYPQLNACLNYLSGIDGMEAACEGYRQAAEVLLAEVTERSGILDVLIYPIVFNWRHYVELRLKIIFLVAHALYEDQKAPIPRHHRVDDLWKLARPYVVRHWPNGPESELKKLDEHIGELARNDRDSYVFRYTVNKEGQPALPQTLFHIGVVEFREVSNKTADLLEGISSGLNEALQNHAAYLAEMRSEEAEYQAEMEAEAEAEYLADLEAEYADW